MNRLDKQKKYFNSQITKPIAFRKEALDKLEKGLKAYETKIYAAFKQDLSKPEMEVYTTEIAVVYRSIRDAKKILDNG
ncbi:hypothetical protein MX850_07280 [Erysipelothrix sp. Poltava]|nr:hypothetical protein MX850_07280 [Erysipelothrix sp. Poltava]